MLHCYSFRIELVTATSAKIDLMICYLWNNTFDELYVSLLIDWMMNRLRSERISFAFLQTNFLSTVLGLLQRGLDIATFLILIFREWDFRKYKH